MTAIVWAEGLFDAEHEVVWSLQPDDGEDSVEEEEGLDDEEDWEEEEDLDDEEDWDEDEDDRRSKRRSNNDWN